MFACLADAVVYPDEEMAAIVGTDTVAFADEYIARSPAPNRAGFRTLLHLAELGPLVLGYGRRLRGLARADRAAYLGRLEHGRLALAFEPLLAVAKLAYYGDDAVMRSLGYDADAVVARGRELRRTEARW
jgi:hypothetical protein